MIGAYYAMMHVTSVRLSVYLIRGWP